ASLRRSVGETKITNSPSSRGGSGSRRSPDPFSLDGVHVSSPLRFLLPPQTSRSGKTKIDSPAGFFWHGDFIAMSTQRTKRFASATQARSSPLREPKRGP